VETVPCSFAGERETAENHLREERGNLEREWEKEDLSRLNFPCGEWEAKGICNL
jgi:hypothetical protein